MVDNSEHLPIGFMDSGIGGISVLREAVRLMPKERFIYFGDSANAPYGTRPREEIRALTYHAVHCLMNQGIKGLAVACNTATSAAVASLRRDYPDLPLVGIEPAIKPAVLKNQGGRILVMATPMTIRQEKFHKLLDIYKDQARICPVPCPGLMEFVEKGELDGAVVENYLHELLDPLLEDTESIVLGCTHYPFLKPELKKILGNRTISLIDGSLGTAKEMKRRLDAAGLLTDQTVRFEETEADTAQGISCRIIGSGRVKMENSSPDTRILDLAEHLLMLPFND